jgi:lipopolysaccharide transport protein LptA
MSLPPTNREVAGLWVLGPSGQRPDDQRPSGQRGNHQWGRARATLAVLGILAFAPHWTPAAAKKEEKPPEITYDASSMVADYKTHELHLKDVTITYGKMTVRADRALATSNDFKNSRWTFNGNVRINAVPRGNLRSDEAVVEFEDYRLKVATATGDPAEFDQTRDDSNVIAKGKADQIVYEVGQGTVRLSSNRHPDDRAWVSDGRNDIRSPVIVYNLREERVEATTSSGSVGSSAPDTRVHVTIDPNQAPRVDGGDTNKPRSPDPSKPQATSPQTAAPATTAPNAAPPAAPQSTPH